jgi:hypothetical protein
MANTFNKDFQRALESKLAVQGAKAGQLEADTGLKNQQAQYVGLDARSAAGLRGAQAGLAQEQGRLAERDVNSLANLRGAQARGEAIGANVQAGTFLSQKRAGDPATSQFDPFSYGGENTAGSIYGNEDSGTIGGSQPYKNDYGMEDPTQYRAEGGLVGSPDMGYAMGGMVQGVPDSIMADYQTYLKAAKGADIPALPMDKAIRSLAAIQAEKRKGVLDMIAKGGTTPQGYAEGGEIYGPGTGKSDSIPAVVDGVQPAAVSDGEFHIPKHVVDYFGTKMLDGLVEKARMAMKVSKNKSNGYAQGGPVKKC